MTERLTIASLAAVPCWVAWQTELRTPKDIKPTKVPYCANGLGGKARANDRRTWATREQAEDRATRLKKPFGMGGIGIEFAPLDDGRSTGGVDLDACRNPETGEIAAWALSIMGWLESYTEVSPSGTGVKVFFTYRTADETMLRKALDPVQPDNKLKFSRLWSRGDKSEHGEAIELHLGNRYFAVTDQILDDSTDELREVPSAVLLRLIEVDGPAFVAEGKDAKFAGISDDEADAAIAAQEAPPDYAKGKRTTIGNLDKSRSALAFKVGGASRRRGETYEQMCEALRQHPDTVDWYLEKGAANGGRELRRIWEKTDPATAELLLSRGKPLHSARQFVLRHYTLDGARTLLHQNASFYGWRGSHYEERAFEEMRAGLYAFLDTAKTIADDGEVIDFDPTKTRVANVMEALAAECQPPKLIRPPAWLTAEENKPASEIIACANKLLHLPTGETRDHTPHLFTLNALPFDYQPNAPQPVNFLRFLATIWPEDQQSIDTLQEIFGLCLTAETRYQKLFLMVGPKRSGKGTIARILTQLLGPDNVAGPTLSGLGTNFGLAPLIGKRLAIISDARLSGKADQQVIVERLLSITGEDGITIDRKFRDGWTGKLDARFVVMTNELPRLTDSSGALAGRFIILRMVNSFYGKEDLGLGEKLTPELPSILLWAIAGWKRLTERGHFVPPASSAAAQQELEDLGSPIGAFLRDTCIVAQGQSANAEAMFSAWRTWCLEQGRDHAGTKQTFGRDLAAAVPRLKVTQPRAEDGTRLREYEGVGFILRDHVARAGTRSTPLYAQLSDDPPPHTEYPYS